MIKPTTEQTNALKNSTEAMMTLSEVVFSGFERLVALNLNVARAAFEDGISATQSLSQVKDAKGLKDLPNPLAGNMTEKAAEYFRNVQQITTEMQEEVTKVMSQQMSAIGMGVTGSNQIFDMFNKVAKQATDMTKANIKKATENTEKLTEQATEMTKANVKTATENTEKLTESVIASSKKSG